MPNRADNDSFARDTIKNYVRRAAKNQLSNSWFRASPAKVRMAA